MAVSGTTEARRAQLLENVRLSGFASMPELVSQLGVSESTVRRDLDFLVESGSVKRTHGGVFYSGPSPKLPHFDLRQEAHWDKKRSIARRAAALIDDDDVVLLDGGSTTYELAQLLLDRPVQVVTNSLPVANLFSSKHDHELILLGGYVHQRTGAILGPYTNQMLAGLNVRRAVLSVGGVSERGFFNSNLLLVETERAMMHTADEVIVVADSTKFGRRSLSHLCSLDTVDKLVVDEQIDPVWRDKVVAEGVELIIAPMIETQDNKTD